MLCLAGGQPHQAQQAWNGGDSAGKEKEGRQGAYLDFFEVEIMHDAGVHDDMMITLMVTMVNILYHHHISDNLDDYHAHGGLRDRSPS